MFVLLQSKEQKHEHVKNLQQRHTDQEFGLTNLSAKTMPLVGTFYKFL